MSDDLVKMCKRLSKHAHAQLSSTDLEIIADRIEELEAKLATCEKYRNAYAECDRIGTQAVRDLEAKLAKAVAFIEFLDENYRHVWGETARLKIRTLHAELKGGKADE
jgi:hypothetical protein